MIFRQLKNETNKTFFVNIALILEKIIKKGKMTTPATKKRKKARVNGSNVCKRTLATTPVVAQNSEAKTMAINAILGEDICLL